MKLASACPSNRSSTLPALILERLPCAASTCSDAPLSARIVPTRNAPSSSKRICVIRSSVPEEAARGPVHDLGNVFREGDERVIAAAHHRVQRAFVERDRLAVVEHLVGGLEEYPVAFGPRDGSDVEDAKLIDMLRREDERFSRVEVALRPEMAREMAIGMHGGIQQRRAAADALGRDGGVKAAERAADEGELFGTMLRAGGEHLLECAPRTVIEDRDFIADAGNTVAHVIAEHHGLARLRRADEPMQVHDRAHATRPRSKLDHAAAKLHDLATHEDRSV